MNETDLNTIWNFGSDLFDGGLLSFTIRAAIIIVVAKILTSLVSKAITKSTFHQERDKLTIQYVTRMIKTVVYIIAGFFVLSAVIPLAGLGTAVLGATSVLSVVLGLAAQETFSNFIAGFFLSLSKPFSVGDLISLPEKNITGTVQEITFRHTLLKTVESTQVIIPNGVMNTSVIENKVYGQSTYTRFIKLSIGYDADVELAQKIITDTVLNTEGILDLRSKEEIQKGEAPFAVRVSEFLSSGIELTFPVNTVDLKTSLLASSSIRKELLKKFKENNIEIPYNKIQLVDQK